MEAWQLLVFCLQVLCWMFPNLIVPCVSSDFTSWGWKDFDPNISTVSVTEGKILSPQLWQGSLLLDLLSGRKDLVFNRWLIGKVKPSP